jgi:hypothetical protein
VKIWVGSFASCFIHGIHGGKIMGTMIIGTYVVLGVARCHYWNKPELYFNYVKN